MKKNLILAASAVLLLAACSEPISELEDVTPENETPADSKTVVLSPEELCLIQQIANKTPKISPEAAQETAMQLLGLQNQTSSLIKKMTATVFCNKKQVYNSLTKSYKQEEDTAFYVFNTPDEQGFAIVAADLRVPNQVLAYSDNGSFDPDTDNPGMALFLEMAKDYVAERIATAEAQEDSLTESICQKLGIKTNDNSNNGLRSKSKVEYIRCTTAGLPTYHIDNRGHLDPMLKTQWDQCLPYNTYCRGEYAGCGPIAVAKIMAYWKFPRTLDNVTLNWNLISNNASNDQIATMISLVNKGMNTKDGITNTSSILKFLKKTNYSDQSKTKDYNYANVVNTMDLGRPVLMIGFRDDTPIGHVWVADGYVIRLVTTEQAYNYAIIETADDGTVTVRYEDIPSTTVAKYELLHFNWGWGGRGDGYYDQKVFDTKRQMVENAYGEFMPMESDDISSHKYYSRNLQVVTDITPRY